MKKNFKILYAEDIKEIRDIYGTMIEGELDCELVEFICGNDLIEYLKVHSDVDLVLTDYNMPDGTGGDVYNYLKKNGNKIPCFLISSDQPEDHEELSDFYQTNKNNLSLLKPFSIEELLESITKLVPLVNDNEYRPIKVERFLNYNPVDVDIYIRLSDTKYVKLLNQGETFTPSQLERYVADKMVSYFYILSSEFHLFVESYSEKLKILLSRNDLKIEQKIGAQLAGAALVLDICSELGINENTIDVVNSITKSTLSVIKKNNPKIFGLLSKLMNSNGFLYSHSLMVSYISSEIAQRMKWSSTEIYKKFSIAALLHDIGLSEELSKYNELTEDLLKELREIDIKTLREHPHRSYELSREIDTLPSDVDTLILTHHERPDGSGFPRGLGSLKTSPLSCTFILAHEFVHQIFEHNGDYTKAVSIVDSMKTKFNVGNYKKPFEGLVLIVKNEPRP